MVDAVMDQKESKREDSELERIQNEYKRATDEVIRQQNENVRQSNEATRIANESDRKTQENRRATAETNRVNAETTRRNNENSRISNETERQKVMNEMKSLIGNVNDFDERVGVIEDEIDEINSSLDNIKMINVKEFGAIGDGLQNDTSAIQNCIDSITDSAVLNNPKSYEVYFPKGDYIVDEMLILRPNISFVGDGGVNLRFNNNNNYGVKIGDKSITGGMKADNITFRNISFIVDGNYNYGILIQWALGCKFENCYFNGEGITDTFFQLGSPTSNINLGNDASYTKILNCYFNKTPNLWVRIGTSNANEYVDTIHIDKCEFSYGQSGIEVYGLNNIHITNNRFDLTDSDVNKESYGIKVITSVKGLEISGNYFEARHENMKHISIDTLDRGGYVSGFVCIGNSFNAGTPRRDGKMLQPAILLNKVQDGIIIGNIFDTGYNNTNNNLNVGGVYINDIKTPTASYNFFTSIGNHGMTMCRPDDTIPLRYLDIKNGGDNTSFSDTELKLNNLLLLPVMTTAPSISKIERSGGIFIERQDNNTDVVRVGVKNYNNALTYKRLMYHDYSTTQNRPTGVIKGYMFFDTTIGKPIWWNGTVWVDSNGSAV